MLWKNRRESDNVVDQRSIGGGTIGIGTLLVGAVIYGLMGRNPLDFIAQNAGEVRHTQSAGTVPGATNGARPGAPHGAGPEDERKRFVSVVLADTEDVWNGIFRANHRRYVEPKLVLFTHAVQSACGRASTAVGPFYCPGDQRVYLDLGFFDQLSHQLGAGGDFAQAYVVAHEVGHHVQNLLGLMHSSRDGQASIRTELQADCLAGVWAKQTENAKHVIEAGDIGEAINAAAAVGDDRLQMETRGYVVPDSFTHGTSAQRVQAFRTGYASGDPRSCIDAYR